MTLQILTLYLKDDVQLTGLQQEPACRQMLTALSSHLKPTAIHQITFLSSPSRVELLIGASSIPTNSHSITNGLNYRSSAYGNISRNLNVLCPLRTIVFP